MVILKNFIHRLRCQNHLNVSITDSGSERVKCTTTFNGHIQKAKQIKATSK